MTAVSLLNIMSLHLVLCVGRLLFVQIIRLSMIETEGIIPAWMAIQIAADKQIRGGFVLALSTLYSRPRQKYLYSLVAILIRTVPFVFPIAI